MQSERFYPLWKERRKKWKKGEDETEVCKWLKLESNLNFPCSFTKPYLCCWLGGDWWNWKQYSSFLKLLPVSTHNAYKAQIKLLIKLGRPAARQFVSVAVSVRKDVKNEKQCKTEKVIKYTCSSRSFELVIVSVPPGSPVGRLTECLLAWLPKVLSTCHCHWLFSALYAWLFWVSG